MYLELMEDPDVEAFIGYLEKAVEIFRSRKIPNLKYLDYYKDAVERLNYISISF